MAQASLPRSVRTERVEPLRGQEVPRLFTPPLRRLSRKTSLGPEVVEFAETMLGVELMPWQKWWLLHALEVDRNGDFRYRTVLTLVARQSGKTTLLKVLALAFMYLGRARLVLGAAQSRDIAKESWEGAVELAESDPELRAEIENVRKANGDQEFRLVTGARYRIAAATRSAGRGLSVDLLILDELREHRDWSAWGALSKTTIARPNALTVGISNAGDDESAVLNSLRDRALAGTDSSIALFEWSAAEDCALDDRVAWAQANPGLGYTISEQAIASALATDPPAVFRTEVLCQRVESLDSAVDFGAWKACKDPALTMDPVRDRVIACVDVAPDGRHVALLAAGVTEGGVVLVEPVDAWDSTEEAREHLPELIEDMQPVATAWFPSGPAAALAPLMRSMTAIEIKGSDVVACCMGFADLVRARKILQPGDPLLDAHVAGASKLMQGDGWRFSRKGGHCNAAYAAAGAAWVALTLPEEKPAPWFGVV